MITFAADADRIAADVLGISKRMPESHHSSSAHATMWIKIARANFRCGDQLLDSVSPT